MDEDYIVCRCEEVTRDEVLDALKDGARDLSTVKRWTRCGMGACQGKTCSRLVVDLLQEHASRDLDEIDPVSARAPVRPLLVTILMGDAAPDEEDPISAGAAALLGGHGEERQG